ncbi:hypothetical protein NIES22_73740 (plasmid) [Calothrix brevissima NIES-22]|nr:hypothetical protein NIES22_73740 [Calothrix brevissima NIES-22]
MSGFTLFRRGECPVCNGSAKGCRQSSLTGLIFCRSHEAQPTNHIYRGEDVHGFGLWQAVEDAQAFTSQASEERERRRREFLEAEEHRRQLQIQKQLPANKRNKWYRLLLNELTLSDSDFLKLLERGFTPEQIINDGYKSVRAWQKLSNSFPSNLPGVLPNGVLNVSGDGILCPFSNKNSLIVSCQVRLHEATDGKCRWLTSSTKKNPEGATSHLNGELPIGVFEPENFTGDSIWLTEGTSIKPSLTRYRLGVPVLGASGGRFDGSPETSRQSVAYLCEKYRTKLLTFAVDAGDVVNRSGVPQRWKQQIEFFSSLGYECRIAWWNQITKDDCDIDELEDYSQIEFISLDEFLSIANQQQQDIPKSQQIKTTDSTEWQQEYEAERSDRAKFKFTRKPDVEISEGYLPTYNLSALPPGIIAIKGDWGIGKSFFTGNLAKQWEGKILQLAHLNAILHNTAPKYDLLHHHEAKSLNLSLTSVPRLAICDVTLAANFSPEHWAKGEPFILIWDEVCQGLKSLHTSPNLRGNLRVKARVKIEWLIKNATYIVLADRDLDDETISYIESVRGVNKSFIIHHIGKKGKTRKPITINTNKRKDEKLSQLIKDAKAGLKIAVACETKSDLLALEKLLIDAKIPESAMFFAHGDNSNEPHIKAVIETIDSQYTDYQILGYTMTMGTAVSLEKEHFDKVYAFFPGDVLAASEHCQMLFRNRPDCEIEIWVSPRRRSLEIDPSKLLNNLKITTNETNQLVTSIDEIDKLHKQGILPTARGEITSDDLPFLQHKLNIITRANASKANPFQSLYDLLLEAGFTINLECTDTEESARTDDGEIHSEQKQVIKEENDRLIAQAELMSDAEFEAAKLNAGSLRKSERDRLQKTQLHRDTGLEITKDIVKLQRTKKLTRGAKMLKVLLGDDATAASYDIVDRERNPDIGDQNFFAAKRRLLLDLGTDELIAKLRDGWTYTKDSPEIQEFGDRVRQQKADVKRLLGFKVSLERNSKGNFKISNAELLGRVLDSMCILRSSEKHRVLGRIYSLNTQHWETLEKIMAHMDTQAHTPTLQGVIEKAKLEASQDTSSQTHEGTDMNEQITVNSQQSMVNGQQSTTESDWITEESLQEVAAQLDYCQNPEMLNQLRGFTPPEALKLAARRLPPEKRELIRQWVINTAA